MGDLLCQSGSVNANDVWELESAIGRKSTSRKAMRDESVQDCLVGKSISPIETSQHREDMERRRNSSDIFIESTASADCGTELKPDRAEGYLRRNRSGGITDSFGDRSKADNDVVSPGGRASMMFETPVTRGMNTRASDNLRTLESRLERLHFEQETQGSVMSGRSICGSPSTPGTTKTFRNRDFHGQRAACPVVPASTPVTERKQSVCPPWLEPEDPVKHKDISHLKGTLANGLVPADREERPGISRVPEVTNCSNGFLQGQQFQTSGKKHYEQQSPLSDARESARLHFPKVVKEPEWINYEQSSPKNLAKPTQPISRIFG